MKIKLLPDRCVYIEPQTPEESAALERISELAIGIGREPGTGRIIHITIRAAE